MSSLPTLACSALLALTAVATSGCDKAKAPETPTTSSASSAAASGPLPGVVASPDLTGASDRSGAPAVGAMEAGQASGGHKVGGSAQATGGDGSAGHAPASAASK